MRIRRSSSGTSATGRRVCHALTSSGSSPSLSRQHESPPSSDWQVDIIENPPGSEVPGLKSGNTRVVFQVKGDMELVAMQIDQEPFDDNKVREAMKYALDRQQMARLVAQGRGTIVNDIPIASFLQYALPGPARAHDVSKAKALLKQAGYGDGLEVTDRKSTRLNSSHIQKSRMPSSA